MPHDIRDIIDKLEERGYTVLGYCKGRFRIAGILGWRDIAWAHRVLRRAAI